MSKSGEFTVEQKRRLAEAGLSTAKAVLLKDRGFLLAAQRDRRWYGGRLWSSEAVQYAEAAVLSGEEKVRWWEAELVSYTDTEDQPG